MIEQHKLAELSVEALKRGVDVNNDAELKAAVDRLAKAVYDLQLRVVPN